jgi:hypothetical protein
VAIDASSGAVQHTDGLNPPALEGTFSSVAASHLDGQVGGLGFDDAGGSGDVLSPAMYPSPLTLDDINIGIQYISTPQSFAALGYDFVCLPFFLSALPPIVQSLRSHPFFLCVILITTQPTHRLDAITDEVIERFVTSPDVVDILSSPVRGFAPIDTSNDGLLGTGGGGDDSSDDSSDDGSDDDDEKNSDVSGGGRDGDDDDEKKDDDGNADLESSAPAAGRAKDIAKLRQVLLPDAGDTEDVPEVTEVPQPRRSARLRKESAAAAAPPPAVEEEEEEEEEEPIDWNSWSAVELRAECRERGLNPRGKKAELVARLEEDEEEDDEE